MRPFAVMLKMTSGKKRFAHALHRGMQQGERERDGGYLLELLLVEGCWPWGMNRYEIRQR